MKVAFITEFFAPHIGGQEFRFERFATLVAKFGAKVDVFTIDYLGSLPEKEKLKYFTINRYVKIKGYSSGTNRSNRNMFNYTRATVDLVNKIRGEYNFIIINQMPVMHLLYIKPYKNIMVDWCEYWESGIKHILLDKAIKRFDNGICVSDYILENLKQVNPNGNFRRIYTPIGVGAYRTNRKSNNIRKLFYIGRIESHKNVLNMIQAVIKANSEQGRNFELTIAGSGPLLDKAIGLAKGINYIKILGKISDKEKIREFKRADAFIMPSTREGLPNSVLEAIAAGLPVITVTSKTNNFSYLIKSKGLGIVAEDSSTEKITEALLLVSNEKLIERIRYNLARFIKELSVEKIEKELHMILK